MGYTEEGRQKRKTVYGKTQKDVREKLEAIKQQLSQGTFSDTKLTVKGYLEQWLTEKARQVKPRTADDYLYECEKYIIPRIGQTRLDKLTPLKVQAMCSEIADAVSPDRANKSRAVLSRALKQAVKWNLISINPCEAVDPQKHIREEMKIWTSEEAARFLDIARAHRLYALFYLAIATGMRRGELLGLRWQDVSENSLRVRQSLVERRGKITISTPKTKKGERRISLFPNVIEVLAAHRKRQEAEALYLGRAWPDTGLVFVSTVGSHMHPPP